MHWIALKPTLDAVCLGEALADPTTALTWWALQFTPLVALVEGALVLEVSASERLYGGRAALVHRICRQTKPVTSVLCAQGATALVALGRLWSAAPEAHPDTLPLQALSAARAHLPTLVRLGCTSWGHLRALPRAGVARRFGADLVDALDRAYGSAPEVYPWLQLPEVFDVPLELSASVEDASALLFGARRLLAQLHAWLQARHHGVLALELLWQLDARRSNALYRDNHHNGGSLGRLLLRTSQPTQDMQHLQRLLAEQLAQVSLPAPVLHLRLRSLQTQALAGESRSLLVEDLRPGDSLQQLLERLNARLGAKQVLRVELEADHCPERMQQWRAATHTLQSCPAGPVKRIAPSRALCSPSTGVQTQWGIAFMEHADLYPSWLLATPLRLVVHDGVPQYLGHLDLLAGPHRMETGWFDGVERVALRDYFVARSQTAGLVWVYRERLSGRMDADKAHWYLHGLFA